MPINPTRSTALFAGLSAGLLAVAACQTDPGAPPELSLESAKKVTTTFKDTSFTPPPRTIDDITAILDQQKQAKTGATETREIRADATPPEGGDATALLRFYFRRGESARQLGRSGQALKDLREAGKYLNSATAGARFKAKVYQRLAFVESTDGNPLNAIKYMNLSLRERPSPGSFQVLVKYYARAGNMKKAKRTWKRGRNFIARQAAKGKGGGPQALKIGSARLDYEFFNAQGRHRKAEAAMRQVIEAFEKGGRTAKNPSFLPSRKKQLAGSLKKQGRLVEAEVVAREALLEALAGIGRNNATTADVARQLAGILLSQGRYTEAEKLSREAIDIFEKSGTRRGTPSLGRVQRFLIDVLAAQEDWKGAVAQFEETRADMKGNSRLFAKMFLRHQASAIALLKTGRTAEAMKMLTSSFERTRGKLGEKHAKTAGWGALLAMAQAHGGDKKAALAGFRAAVPVLLSRSRGFDDEDMTESFREQRTGMILESYIDLLADVRGTGVERDFGIDAAAEAFTIADVARGRSVQKAVAASGARATAGNPELADIARREQDAKKQIASLYALLANVLASPTDQQDAVAVQSLKTGINQLSGARTTLMEEIEARFPEYAELINPKPGTIDMARSVLRPGEALISIYVGRKRTYVWAVPRQGKTAFVAAPIGGEDLADYVGLLRSSLDPNVYSLNDIPDFDVATAYDLYQQILAPVESGWKSANSLLVVAHGPLGYLPLSVLPTGPAALKPAGEGQPMFANHRGVPWLARTHAVTVLPSVASLKTLRDLPPGSDRRKPFAGFGDPYFNVAMAAEARRQKDQTTRTAALTNRGPTTRGLPVRLRAAPDTVGLADAGLGQLPRLPDTSEEIISIALALSADLSRDVFLGEKASEGMVKSTDLSRYKVLAFATHGLVPGDLNGLTQPALALSAPEVSGGDDDGLLTLDEILGLRLDADWVILSACNTGTGNGAGAEAVTGLGRAFFYAGTRALLVSNWPVETTSAKTLTTDLFRRQAKDPTLTRAEALRRSMTALIDGLGYVEGKSGKAVFSYAHPIFWAPFSLIGDGGGGAAAP